MSGLQGSTWLGGKLVSGLASIDEGLENANILGALSPGEEGSEMVDAQTGEIANDYSDVHPLPLGFSRNILIAHWLGRRSYSRCQNFTSSLLSPGYNFCNMSTNFLYSESFLPRRISKGPGAFAPDVNHWSAAALASANLSACCGPTCGEACT